MATKLLFADDQLPDDEIADGDVCDVISKRYPRRGRHGFITAFVKLRGIVSALRDRNYDVTIANTYDKAIRLARDECFDIAIIDLGWSGDHSLEPARQRDAGWAIANQLRESDRSHKRTMPTAQIIYSSRFASNPDIGSQACKDGILPFFKVYSERVLSPFLLLALHSRICNLALYETKPTRTRWQLRLGSSITSLVLARLKWMRHLSF